MIVAIEKSMVAEAELMLSHGADLNLQDRFGQSAFDYAIRSKNKNLIAMLSCALGVSQFTELHRKHLEQVIKQSLEEPVFADEDSGIDSFSGKLDNLVMERVESWRSTKQEWDPLPSTVSTNQLCISPIPKIKKPSVFYDKTPLESFPINENVFTDTNWASETDSFKPRSLWQVTETASQPWKFSVTTAVTKDNKNPEQECLEIQNQIKIVTKSIAKLEKVS
jgi:hypothetical protein